MRKLIVVTSAAALVATAAALTLPAFGETQEDGTTCAGQTGNTGTGPLDLSQIPVKPVTGKLSVGCAGGEDEDDIALGTRVRRLQDDNGSVAEVDDD